MRRLQLQPLIDSLIDRLRASAARHRSPTLAAGPLVWCFGCWSTPKAYPANIPKRLFVVERLHHIDSFIIFFLSLNTLFFDFPSSQFSKPLAQRYVMYCLLLDIDSPLTCSLKAAPTHRLLGWSHACAQLKAPRRPQGRCKAPGRHHRLGHRPRLYSMARALHHLEESLLCARGGLADCAGL